MKNLILILIIVVAAGAVVYLVKTQPSQESVVPDVNAVKPPDDQSVPYVDADLSKKGVPAPGKPKFDVKVELKVDAKGRNRFHFTISEEHGWAANALVVELRHIGLPEKTGKGMKADRRLTLTCTTEPLRFDSDLHHTVTVASYEFPELDNFGTSENWLAEVKHYGDLTAKAGS
ncbi:MAG: hypothetical protein KAV82_13425 [Phycisphaerae bacterium]|nr:hypothetical protein [Phycisphaerae bacterium]